MESARASAAQQAQAMSAGLPIPGVPAVTAQSVGPPVSALPPVTAVVATPASSGLTGAVAERAIQELKHANLALLEENERLRREARRRDDELKRLHKEVEAMKARVNELGATAPAHPEIAPASRLLQVNFPCRNFPHEIEDNAGSLPADEARWALAKTIYTMIEVKLVDSAGKQVPGTALQEGGLHLRLSLHRADTLEELLPEHNPNERSLFHFQDTGDEVRMQGSHHKFRFKLLMLSSYINRAQMRIRVAPVNPQLAAREELVVVTRAFTSLARRDSTRGVSSGEKGAANAAKANPLLLLTGVAEDMRNSTEQYDAADMPGVYDDVADDAQHGAQAAAVAAADAAAAAAAAGPSRPPAYHVAAAAAYPVAGAAPPSRLLAAAPLAVTGGSPHAAFAASPRAPWLAAPLMADGGVAAAAGAAPVYAASSPSADQSHTHMSAASLLDGLGPDTDEQPSKRPRGEE